MYPVLGVPEVRRVGVLHVEVELDKPWTSSRDRQVVSGYTRRTRDQRNMTDPGTLIEISHSRRTAPSQKPFFC